MSINSTVINGAVVNGDGGGAPSGTRSIRPVHMGRLSISVGVAMAPLQPVRFGVPTVKNGTDVVLKVGSLRPVRMGLLVAYRGMPPSAGSYPVAPLRPVRFGVPTAVSNKTVQVAPMRPVRMGPVLASTAVAVASLRPVSLGGLAVASRVSVAPLRPVRMGKPAAVLAVSIASLRPLRMGPVRVEDAGQVVHVASLRPVHLGVIDASGITVRVRPCWPVRLGPVTISRGSEC